MTNQTDNMIGRAIVRRVEDSGPRQAVQIEVTKGELIDGVPRMQNYGITSVPPSEGCDAVVVFLGGDREQGIIIAMENKQYRLVGLKPGEHALYDDLGNMIKFGRDKLEVVAVTEMDVVAPILNIRVTQLNVEAERTDITGDLFNNGVNVGSTHTHSGVTPGDGVTGGPQ